MSLLVTDCPRCGANAITFDVSGGVSAGAGNNGWQRRYEVFAVCRRCGRATVFALEIERYEARERYLGLEAFRDDRNSLNRDFKVLGPISLKDRAQVTAPEFVPDDIATVFNEGAVCMTVRCWNAASTMFRLCLDLATRPLLPPNDAADERLPNGRQRRDLGLRIPWLIEHGKLPKELADVAGAVREDGNDGAHAGNLEEEDAADLLDFTVVLLERLFTEPGRLAVAAERRVERRRPREERA